MPVGTSANWFHDYIIGKAEIRYVKGRIRFNGAPYTAPFSSMIIVWGRTGTSTFEQEKIKKTKEPKKQIYLL